MTHFVILVIAETEAKITDLLAPYSEHIQVAPYNDDTTREEVAATYEKVKRDLLNPTTKPQYVSEDHLIELIRNNMYSNIATLSLEDFAWEWYGQKLGATHLLTTYNPQSKWDWYEIGGRWDNIFDLTPPQNSFTGKEFLAKNNQSYVPSVIVTPDGVWHSEKNWGWWACYEQKIAPDTWNELFTQILTQFGDSRLFVVDCYI